MEKVDQLLQGMLPLPLLLRRDLSTSTSLCLQHQPYSAIFISEVIYEMFHILNCGFEIKKAIIIAYNEALRRASACMKAASNVRLTCFDAGKRNFLNKSNFENFKVVLGQNIDEVHLVVYIFSYSLCM